MAETRVASKVVQGFKVQKFKVGSSIVDVKFRRPTIQNPKSQIQNLKRRLVEGIQVITGEGVLSGSGHLSARVPGTETFLINPRFAGVLADPKDICTVTFDGKRIAGKGPIPSESPIHAAVYRSRPDVG
ncbi:MAG TPA: class II aldolase/adducin family protein, partial [Candidatus Binatus sp.]|nr:class II aldolase/adducin family protein [Candidatus Binatus sp.]